MAKYVIISDSSYQLSVKSGGTITFDTGTNNGETKVTGSFTVLGENTDIQSTNVTIRDNILTLNNGESGVGVTPDLGTAGIEIDRGQGQNVQILFNEDFQGEKTFNFQYANEEFIGIGTDLILTNGADLRLITKGNNVVTVEGTDNYEDQLLDYSNNVALNKNDDYLTNLRSVTDFVHNFSDYYDPRQILAGDTEITIVDSGIWESYKIYVLGDIIRDGSGNFYICNKGHTSQEVFESAYWIPTSPIPLSTIDVKVDDNLVSQWTLVHFDVFDLQVKDNILTTKSGTDDIVLLGSETPNGVVTVAGTTNYSQKVVDYETSANGVAIPFDNDIIPNSLSVVEYIGNYASYSTPSSLIRGDTSFVLFNEREWEPYTIYMVNDIVTINGQTYKCKFPHISSDTFSLLYIDSVTTLWESTVPSPESTISVTFNDVQVSQWTADHFDVFDLKITSNILTSRTGTDNLILLGDSTPNNVVTVEGTTNYEQNVLDYLTSGNGVALPVNDDIIPNTKAVVDYIGNYSSYSFPKKIQRDDTSIEISDSPQWEPYTIYIINDIVTYLGGSYICKWPHVSDNTFSLSVNDITYWESTDPILNGFIDVTVDDNLVSKWTSTYFNVFGLSILETTITTLSGTDDIILLGDSTPNNIVTVEGTIDYEKNVLDYVTSGNGVALPVTDDIIPNAKAVIDYIGNYSSYSSPKTMKRGDTYVELVDAGLWAPYTIYMVNDVVDHEGTSYKCLFPHISPTTFSLIQGTDTYWEITDLIPFGRIDVTVDDQLISQWTSEYFNAFNIQIRDNIITSVSGIDDIILLGQGNNVVTLAGTTNYENQVLDYVTSGNGVAILKGDDIVPNIKSVADYLGNYYSYTTQRLMKRYQTSFELFSLEGWTRYHNYILGDIVYDAPAAYICITPHTSSFEFETDLLDAKWEEIPLPELNGKFELRADNILTQQWTGTQVDIFGLGFYGTTIKTVSGIDNITLIGSGQGVVNVLGTVDYEDKVLDYLTSNNGVAIPAQDDIIPNIKSVVDYVGNYFSYTTPRKLRRGDTLIEVVDFGDWTPYTNYIVDDVVAYSGILYKCIEGHTSLASFNPIFWGLTLPIESGKINVEVDGVFASQWTNQHFDAFGIRTKNTTITSVTGSNNITFFGEGFNVINVTGTTDYELQVFNYENIVAISIDDDTIPNTKALTDYIGNYFSYTTPKLMERGGTSISITDVAQWTPYTNYIVDDLVIYNFMAYKCLIPHTSLGIDSFVADLAALKWEFASPPENSYIEVSVNDSVVSKWTDTNFDVFDLTITDNKIETISNNSDLILTAQGSGSVVIDSSLRLVETTVEPLQPGEGSTMYSLPSGAGGTGIFYVNNNNRFKSDNVTQEPIRDELVSKRKAIAYSFIF